MAWQNVGTANPKQFTCGYCGHLVASNHAYHNNVSVDGSPALIYICPNCSKPIYFQGDNPTPGIRPGVEVANVPRPLHDLYQEARSAVSVAAFTASVLASRKMLMNIAVDNGATEGQSFIQYVEYLAEKNFVPPNGRGWVDHIRKKGNEATHEIALMSKDDAIELVTFVEMLLKFIYEFPARVPPVA
jgi:hypothetical protein